MTFDPFLDRPEPPRLGCLAGVGLAVALELLFAALLWVGVHYGPGDIVAVATWVVVFGGLAWLYVLQRRRERDAELDTAVEEFHRMRSALRAPRVCVAHPDVATRLRDVRGPVPHAGGRLAGIPLIADPHAPSDRLLVVDIDPHAVPFDWERHGL